MKNHENPHIFMLMQGAYGVGKTRKSREFENLIFLTWKCREFGSSVWKSQGFDNTSYICFIVAKIYFQLKKKPRNNESAITLQLYPI